MGKFIRTLLQAVGALTLTCLLLLIGLLAFAGYWMDIDETPVKADYILPLAGGNARIAAAADLYNGGFAPVILFSNARELPPKRIDIIEERMGYPLLSQETYFRTMCKLLCGENVPIQSFGNGHISTVEEAEALKTYLGGRKVRLLIVTAPNHARRAKMIFEKILPNCDITMTATKEAKIKKRWWADQLSAQMLIMEFAKTAHFLVGGAFRSTDPIAVN